MDPVSFFFFLAFQAVEVFVLLAPMFSIPTVVGFIWAVREGMLQPGLLRGKWLWVLLPFLIPVLILVYGVVFKYAGRIGTAPAWREAALNYILLAHVLLVGILLVLLRRAPLIVLGLSALPFGLSISASVMASMSVTNGWW
jgi:hypothetical protein